MMMELPLLFAKGLGIGLALAAPVGPVGAMCIRKAITVGRMSSVTSGLGAATADAFYGAIAAFGLTAVSSYLVQYQTPATFVGGLFLLWLSYKFLSSARQNASAGGALAPTGLWSGYLTTFLMTITNPATILSFLAIFAGIGFVGASDPMASVTLVVGVFLGSALWWVILAFLTVELQKRIGGRFATFANIASSLIIGLFGIVALVSLLF